VVSAYHLSHTRRGRHNESPLPLQANLRRFPIDTLKPGIVENCRPPLFGTDLSITSSVYEPTSSRVAEL
jgi:hypothetical protein